MEVRAVAMETTARVFSFVKSNFWFFVSAIVGSFFWVYLLPVDHEKLANECGRAVNSLNTPFYLFLG
jgi:hypothetical protein